MTDAPIQAALDVMLTDGGGCHLVPPDEWSAQAATVPGSWWPDYDQWPAARSDAPVAAPKTRERGAKAPGSYVHAR